MSTNVCEVIITAPDADWLAAFTRRLLDARLVAAGHIVTPIRSIYRWQGKIFDTSETRVALHTRSSLVPRIITKTNREHPYDVPCIISLPITDGGPTYVQWIYDMTTHPDDC